MTSEEENLVHTLKDIKSIHSTLTFNLNRIKEIQDRLEPRIKDLEERMNGLIAKPKD